MAELTTIARPYAKAAFRFAQEHDAFTKWESMLGLAAAVAEAPAMQDYLRQPSLGAKQKAEAFIDVCGADALDDDGRNFITLLAENDRLAVLPVIFSLFHALVAEQQAIVDAEILSAYELDEKEVERLVASLKQRLGREVRATSTVDASLLGGIVIRAGDTVIDGSVRGRLARLAEQMNS